MLLGIGSVIVTFHPISITTVQCRGDYYRNLSTRWLAATWLLHIRRLNISSGWHYIEFYRPAFANPGLQLHAKKIWLFFNSMPMHCNALYPIFDDINMLGPCGRGKQPMWSGHGQVMVIVTGL